MGSSQAQRRNALLEKSDLLLVTFAHYHVNDPDEKLDPCRACGLDLRHKIHSQEQIDNRGRWGKPTMSI